jgi:hypothetical protein
VLVDQWKTLGSELPEDWSSVHLSLALEQRSEVEIAARLLGPAQPYTPEPGVLRFRVARDGSAPSPVGIQRLLVRVDAERIHGKLSLLATSARAAAVGRVEESLVASWAEAERSLPSDWSHVLGELEVTSTDYVERTSLLCVPMNLRRDGDRPVFRFRCASTFGYGASRGMVRRCLERCDGDGIKGTVRILHAVSDTDSVHTQGPVWLLDSRTV